MTDSQIFTIEADDAKLDRFTKDVYDISLPCTNAIC